MGKDHANNKLHQIILPLDLIVLKFNGLLTIDFFFFSQSNVFNWVQCWVRFDKRKVGHGGHDAKLKCEINYIDHRWPYVGPIEVGFTCSSLKRENSPLTKTYLKDSNDIFNTRMVWKGAIFLSGTAIHGVRWHRCPLLVGWPKVGPTGVDCTVQNSLTKISKLHLSPAMTGEGKIYYNVNMTAIIFNSC